jgi:hypothetical protein
VVCLEGCLEVEGAVCSYYKFSCLFVPDPHQEKRLKPFYHFLQTSGLLQVAGSLPRPINLTQILKLHNYQNVLPRDPGKGLGKSDLTVLDRNLKAACDLHSLTVPCYTTHLQACPWNILRNLFGESRS